MTRLSDESLVDAYLKGDQCAIEELIDRYKVELIGYLVRFLGCHAAAEDVFQNTFLQFHISANIFDCSRRFRPWIYTIATNKARDYCHKNKKYRLYSLSTCLSHMGGSMVFSDLLVADLPNPDEPLLAIERAQIVKRAVDSLPDHLREMILLCYFQRMKYKQIADILHIPLGTVKSRLHTAVAAFAKTIYKSTVLVTN